MQIKSKRKQKRSAAWLTTSDAYDTLCCSGYTRLCDNPEVLTACRTIADQISSMTIYLMSNGRNGDERIKNELSRLLDITPNDYMTRKTFIDCIVMTMLLYGRGNAVVMPHTSNGYLDYLEPIPAAQVSFIGDNRSYTVQIGGVPYASHDVLHFVLNPDSSYPWKGQGLTAPLQDVANNLKQASATANAFMGSKWKPSMIIKVDALTEEFASPAGRAKLMDEYIQTSREGEPWMIPAEQFEVEQIRPLSLADLAISDMVTIDKKTVASIIGVPPFVLDIGEYNDGAWNAFINTKIRPIAESMEQEFTKKLILSPNWYWKFNVASLYRFDLATISDTYGKFYDRGIVSGNEVRDKLSLAPLEGLEKPVILENYIPVDKIGKQEKLGKEDE